MRVHAILIALNEADFITETLRPLYAHCSGISVLTQYDRDYRGQPVVPDSTVEQVLRFPDPQGKLQLVVRRYVDETASRNQEMLALAADPLRGVIPHAWPLVRVREFHARPDYFLIVDADEIYDEATFPRILDYLAARRPRAMRVQAYEYGLSWRFRVPPDKWMFRQFGFVRAGLTFHSRRMLTANEHRLNRLGRLGRLGGDLGSRLLGYAMCPVEVGVFHHGGYVRRDRAQMLAKMRKHSHDTEYMSEDWIRKVLTQNYELVPLECLPRNLREGQWPASFLNDDLEQLIQSLLP